MPPIADASLTSIRYAQESTYGTVPTSVAYKEVRLISETLGQDKEAVQSAEIITDRRSPDNIQVGSAASGELVAELTGGVTVNNGISWDDWWMGAMGAAGFTTILGGTPGSLFSAGTITPSNPVDPDDIVLTIAGGTPANWPNYAAGDFVTTTGFTGVRAPLNRIYKVKSGGGTAALTLTGGPVVPASPGTQPANQIGMLTVPTISDGSTARSFTIERKYAPNTSDFAVLSGMTLTGFTIEMRPKTPVRVTFRFLGAAEANATATNSSSLTAISTAKSFSPVTDLSTFSLNEDGHSFFVNSFTLNFNNGSYAQDERAGNLGAIGIGQGTFDVTGSYEFYYEGGSVHDAYQKFTDQELHIAWSNSAGNALLLHLPRVNWVGGRRSVAGKDQAVTGSVEFRAARGPQYLMRLGRI